MASTLEGSGAARVVVIAHDFPPNPSPQARRTGHLVQGLLAAGHRVQVLTRTIAVDWDMSELPAHPNLEITFCPSDPMQGWVQHVRRWRSGTEIQASATSLDVARTPSALDAPSPLNWKGRFVRFLTRALTTLGFPGASRAWLWHARPALRTMLARQPPDCAVISHEPPAGLMMRRMFSRSRVPFLLELGDPVCTSYTPKRWRLRAFAIEADACRRASRIVVTCAATRDLLMARHGLQADRFSIIPQGFAPQQIAPQVVVRDPARLRLVYTGRLYAFRDPRPLFEAVRGLDMIELVVAAPQAHATIDAGVLPGNVQLAGALNRRDALDLQASADILVNISNRDMPQVPGKFFEYMALPKPILHLTHGTNDEQATLLASLRRGWSVNNEAGDIAVLLARLASQHARGALVDGLDLSPEPVRSFAWPALANTFAQLVERVAQRRSDINEEAAWTLR